jgi:hypothetical protein
MPLVKTLPIGVAFELADLFIAQGWATYHNLRLVIELDYAGEGEEYEEVLAFYPPNGSFRKWTMWRTTRNIAVQTVRGRVICFASVSDALDGLIPTRARLAHTRPAPRTSRRANPRLSPADRHLPP